MNLSQLVFQLNNVSSTKINQHLVHLKRDFGIVGLGSVVICKKRILQKSINCIIWSWINSFYSETKLLCNVWATISVSSLNFNSFMVANPSLPQNREVSRITESCDKGNFSISISTTNRELNDVLLFHEVTVPKKDNTCLNLEKLLFFYLLKMFKQIIMSKVKGFSQ